jgi:hypothetical protein
MKKWLTYVLMGLYTICITVGCYYLGRVDATIDIISSQTERMIDSSQLTVFPNQGRIPDTTIDGVDYYRAN